MSYELCPCICIYCHFRACKYSRAQQFVVLQKFLMLFHQPLDVAIIKAMVNKLALVNTAESTCNKSGECT